MKKFIIILCLLFCSNVAFSLDYSNYNVEDINSVRKATKDFQKEYKNKKESLEAEANFNDFLDFYNKFEIVQSRKIYLPYELKKNSITLQLKEYSKKYYKYGLVAQFDEGEYFLVKSNRYIYENFANYLPQPLQLCLEYENSDERIISDGRYIISKEEICEKIVKYKNFIQKYPEYADKYNIYEKIEILEENLKHYPAIIY